MANVISGGSHLGKHRTHVTLIPSLFLYFGAISKFQKVSMPVAEIRHSLSSAF